MPTSQIETPEWLSMFDLNSDSVVDRRDVDFLVNSMLETTYGDVDLDGRIGLFDLVRLHANLGRAGAGWADGDITGDGRVDRADVAILTSNLGSGGEGSPPASPAAIVDHAAQAARPRRLAPGAVDAVLGVGQVRRVAESRLPQAPRGSIIDRSGRSGPASASDASAGGSQAVLRSRRAARGEVRFDP